MTENSTEESIFGMMELSQADLDYFGRGKAENARFWARLQTNATFDGMKVLDVGCGHGSLCVDIAKRGAQRVLGVDIDKARIDFASENVRKNYPELESVLDFRCCNLSDLAEDDFDVIVSKDSLEHIIGLRDVFPEFAKRLKEDGHMYLGFGPLYKSPFGDHRRTRAKLPWGHVIFPERLLIARLQRQGAKSVSCIEDLGLNKHTAADYRKVFEESGLQIVRFRVNASTHPISRLFSLLRHLPVVGELFSHNLYCVLRKPMEGR